MVSIGAVEHLYLHIPFCSTICPYCDFYSLANLDQKIESYVEALVCEIKNWKSHVPDSLKSDLTQIRMGPLKTIFLGGGTPSKLLGSQLDQILKAAKENDGFADNIEITLECNPGTIDLEKLKEFKLAGVNRISLGVQTLDADELKQLGREHTVAQSVQALAWIREAGFENFSCDLMLGIPGQHLQSYLKTLQTILKYHPTHLSCYMLKVEEGTPFDAMRQKKTLSVPPDEETVKMYEQGSRFLQEHGFEHYEISNFALKSKTLAQKNNAQHNVAIWQGENYLGLGTGAHSCVNGMQFWYPQKLETFLERKLAPEKVGQRDAFDEFLLKIRMSHGVDVALWAEQSGFISDAKLSEILLRYTERGWLQVDGKISRLTLRGMLFSNQILVDVLAWTERCEKHLSPKHLSAANS
jgi:oxygen-independent coproporphyrinogen-3 oxidase